MFTMHCTVWFSVIQIKQKSLLQLPGKIIDFT